MIFTRFGSRIKTVAWYEEDTGHVGGVVECSGGGERAFCWHVSDLKADGGINEIVAAAKQIRNSTSGASIGAEGGAR